MTNFVYNFELDDNMISAENIDTIMQIAEKGINRALDIIREEESETIFDMLSGLERGEVNLSVDNCLDIAGYGIVLQFVSSGVIGNHEEQQE